MASKKVTGKRKRYTDEEKQKVRDFVSQHNSENGRGGAAAASKKFGINQISIGSWLKSTAGKPKVGAAAKTPGSGGRSGVLAELLKVDKLLAAKLKELAELQSRFDQLKKKL